jgi:ABC-type multidrug transport system fused ATPase/permease subunit
VIARLQGGYEQMIGKRFRNGVELSGGEWQKVAISRAYMRGGSGPSRRTDRRVRCTI